MECDSLDLAEYAQLMTTAALLSSRAAETFATAWADKCVLSFARLVDAGMDKEAATMDLSMDATDLANLGHAWSKTTEEVLQWLSECINTNMPDDIDAELRCWKRSWGGVAVQLFKSRT